MKLYFLPGACSMAPNIALREAGLAVTLEGIDKATKKTAGGEDYLRINPYGYVPTLVLDNGETLHEVAVILQYIADQAPAKNLAPARDSFARYRLQEWLNVIATELHKAHYPFFAPGFPDEAKEIHKKLLANRYAQVEGVLAKQPFLMGSQLTVADIYLYVVLRWTYFLKLDMTAFPAINAFAQKMGERASVKEAIAAEGLKR